MGVRHRAPNPVSWPHSSQVVPTLASYRRYLSYTLNSEYIRRQDATSTIINIANNAAGQSLVWDFVRSNWKKLFEE